MIELIEILILAIAQGVGEFLPISSSGHNAVLCHLFERFGTPLTTDSSEFVKLNILLHVGSLVAVLIIFRQRILNMLGKDWRLIPMLIVATIPAVVVGYPIHKFFPWLEDFLPLISVCFIGTGILLLTTLRCSEGEKTTSSMSWLDALIIGCSQAVAVLPGLSRSGTTIVTGLFCRLKREEAAAFSFILSIPIIAGGGLLECLHMIKHHGETEASASVMPTWILLVGALGSCIAGIIALVFLLDWIKKGKLWYFAIWVFVMSPLTMLLFLTTPELETADCSGQTAVEDNVAGDPTPPQAEGTVRPRPLDLPPKRETDEELAAERERILAEERAKEWALIAEERNFIPLVENHDKLIPLDPSDCIWVTPDTKSVVLTGRVVLREGFLELLACRVGSKEHESILSVRVKPYLIHAALLAIGAEQGKPMLTSPMFFPATGDKVDITLRWKDESGKQHECPAQDWVWDMSISMEDSKKPMTTHWVFAGSKEFQDDDGKTHYLANETGELFSLSNFVGSILDVPIRSSDLNTDLQFGCFTERIPPRGTMVTIILSPVRLL